MDILSKFPNDDFYVVFGTSHSAGWCNNGKEILMPKENNWPTQFEKLCGIPVLNLAVGGCTHYEMQNMVIDFLYYYKQQSSKCIGAFIEARQNEYQVWIDKKHATKFDKVKLVPEITTGRDYTDSTEHTSFMYQVASKETAHLYDNYDEIQKWLHDTIEHQLGGMFPYYDSLHVLYNMTKMLNTHDIKNYSFYWVSSDYTDDLESDYNINSTKTIVELSEQMGINFIKFNSSVNYPFFHNNSALRAVADIKGQDWVLRNTCICHHQNEQFHKEFAQIMNKVIHNEQ